MVVIIIVLAVALCILVKLLIGSYEDSLENEMKIDDRNVTIQRLSSRINVLIEENKKERARTMLSTQEADKLRQLVTRVHPVGIVHPPQVFIDTNDHVSDWTIKADVMERLILKNIRNRGK